MMSVWSVSSSGTSNTTAFGTETNTSIFYIWSPEFKGAYKKILIN